jgi:pimeloyl-ACP methyl ester carboxylesterase
MRDPAFPPPTPEPTAQHRGGSGSPLVLLHGITGTWPIWRPVLAGLERHHEVLAPTLPGHWGGPPLEGGDEVSLARLADATERILDHNGIETAHIVGNSLGGWLSIELGRRGRARSVTALSPAGGWSTAADVRRVVRLLSNAQRMLTYRERLGMQALFRRPRFRRLSLASAMEHGDRVPPAEAWLMIEGAAECEVFAGFMDWVKTAAPLAAAVAQQSYPIRIAWAERDKTIPFKRYGVPLLAAMAGAEETTLRGVGHVPMYDDPELVIRTIVEVTSQAPEQQEHPLAERS